MWKVPLLCLKVVLHQQFSVAETQNIQLYFYSKWWLPKPWVKTASHTVHKSKVCLKRCRLDYVRSFVWCSLFIADMFSGRNWTLTQMDVLYVDLFIYSFIHLGYFCPRRAGPTLLKCIIHSSVASGGVIWRARTSYFMPMHISAAIPVISFEFKSPACVVQGEILLLTFDT